jgi:3-hydroxybutyrate dehydrogenase
MFLSDKRAVVTGGGRGIGAAVARALVAEGAAVVLSARRGAEIEAAAAELRQAGGRAVAVPCDVTQPEAVENLRQRATAELGQVDILINNAGVASSATIQELRLEEWERLFAVNARGPFLCTQAFLPGMRERGWGRIVNVASVAGKVGAPYISAYTASKHAVVGFTRALAAEVAASGVTVNAVCPGYVDTPLTDSSVARIVERTGMDAEAVREKLRRMSPQRRLFAPEEVAHLVLMLCHPLAKGVNGQALVLDGGGVQS